MDVVPSSGGAASVNLALEAAFTPDLADVEGLQSLSCTNSQSPPDQSANHRGRLASIG